MPAAEVNEELFNVFSEHRDRVAYLQLSGELDIATSPVLEGWFSHAESNGNTGVVVDLEHLTFMDASGLHSFLRAAERASHSGRDFAIVNASHAVVRILEITGTTHLLGEDPTISCLRTGT